jgi:hypothetical protein
MAASKQKLTASNLKSILWDTLNGVKDKTIDVAQADAVASQSREIVRVIRSQQDVLRHASKKVTKELVDYATK